MKKGYWIFLTMLISLFLFGPVAADDGPDYEIDRYRGVLTLKDDNKATFQEEVTYHFDSSYRGVYLSMGQSGKMPAGFGVGDPENVRLEVDEGEGAFRTVEASRYRFETERLSEGARVKVYYSGKQGDRLRVTADWPLYAMLGLYRDVAVLNWQPITDWDKAIKQVEFEVKGLRQDQKSDLAAHRSLFDKQPTVRSSNGSYHVTTTDLPKGGRFELHGYWDSSQMSDTVMSGWQSGSGREKYEQAEKDIVELRKREYFISKILFPSVSVGLILLGLILANLFRVDTRSKVALPRNARLYEPPKDLAPAVLAYYLEDIRIEEFEKGSPGYKEVIAATLLDLVDRGFLKARIIDVDSEGLLSRRHPAKGVLLRKLEGMDNARPFERELIRMAFGDRYEIYVDQLFDQYKMESVSVLRKQGYTESGINELGEIMQGHIEQDFQRVSDLVVQEGGRLGLPSMYEPLNGKQKSLLYASFICFALSGIISIASPAYYFWKYGLAATSWYYLLLFLVSAGLFSLLQWLSIKQRRHGLVKEEYQEDYYQWKSFRNMLKDIARLDDAELESIVLWNRILVCASLFGYAERVRKTLAIRNIELPSSDLAFAMDPSAHIGLYGVGANVAHSLSQANSASTFSVSSSSGSSGGGFSGGGGGGGGGAF